jgi:hypothetical protein
MKPNSIYSRQNSFVTLPSSGASNFCILLCILYPVSCCTVYSTVTLTLPLNPYPKP